MNQIFVIIAIVLGLLIDDSLTKPVAQSSLDHLIIPYEDDPDSPRNQASYNDQDEPSILTSYNIGVYTGGDFLEVPLGSSYYVGLPDQKIKRTIQKFSLTEPNTPEQKFKLRPGIVLSA